MSRNFLAEVSTPNLLDSDARADELVREFAGTFEGLGGSLVLARAYGQGPAMLLATLPDGETKTPQEIMGGVLEFMAVHSVQVPLVDDQGITE